jgi:hypothetical protein
MHYIPCACSGKIWVEPDPKTQIYQKHGTEDYYHCEDLYPFQLPQIRMDDCKSYGVA